MKDDLTNICDKLEECKEKNPNYNDGIKYTRRVLESYIEGDRDKALKIKALLKIHNNNMYEDLGPISFLLSAITLFVTVIDRVVGNDTVGYVTYFICIFVILLFLLIAILIHLWGNRKFGYRDQWKRYIEVVLEDMEKQNDFSMNNEKEDNNKSDSATL